MSVSLTAVDFFSLSPLFILLGGALFLLLLESFNTKWTKKYGHVVVLIILVGAFFVQTIVPRSLNPLLTSWLRFDELAYFFSLFSLVIGAGVCFLAYCFFNYFQRSVGEYYFLLLCFIFGLILIGSSNDFLTLFLGLETLSISLFVMCGYMKDWEISNEAAIKYFFLGAISTAFFLYGIAFLYGALGHLHLETLLISFQSISDPKNKLLFFSGVAFVTLGLGFKATLFPFHLWAPDVYEGASNPTCALMAIGTKVGAFAGFIRIFLEALPHFDPVFSQAILCLATLTFVFSNFVALRQVQLRRFFAYSGMSHAGLLCLPLAVGGEGAKEAIVFYLLMYSLSTFGAFAVLACLEKRKEGVFLEDLKGLFQKAPLLALFFTLCLLTLGGIPPTAGFIAKFYLFQLALSQGFIFLVALGLLMTVLSTFYYLRIVALMFLAKEKQKDVLVLPKTGVSLCLFTAFCLILVSIFPFIFI